MCKGVSMSNWAEIDGDGIVVRVVFCDNDDPNNDEGYSWLVKNLGGKWVQTSYNRNFRKNFAGPGFYYDEELDAFIPPKPDGDGWILNTYSCQWDNPSLGIYLEWDPVAKAMKTSRASNKE